MSKETKGRLDGVAVNVDRDGYVVLSIEHPDLAMEAPLLPDEARAIGDALCEFADRADSIRAARMN